MLVRWRELQHGDREAVVVSRSERGEGERVVVLIEELGHLVAVQVDLVEAIRSHHDVLLTEIHTAARLARRQLLYEMYSGRCSSSSSGLGSVTMAETRILDQCAFLSLTMYSGSFYPFSLLRIDNQQIGGYLTVGITTYSFLSEQRVSMVMLKLVFFLILPTPNAIIKTESDCILPVQKISDYAQFHLDH